MNRVRISIHSCFMLFLILFSCLAFPQQAAPPAQNTSQAASPESALSGPSTVLKVKTRLVVVDVVARNSKGQPVADLKSEDFTLTEDGKPQNVNRPGIKLRYRLGYFADDREAYAKADQAHQDAALDQSLNLDWPVATAIPFVAQVLAPSADTQNKIVVRYRIDPHGLSFEQGQDGLHHVAVLCAVRAYSTKDSDKIVKAEANNMEGALRPEAYTKVINGFFPCQEQIELPAGDYFLRLGVRDNATGLIGTATARVTVASSAATSAPKSEAKP